MKKDSDNDWPEPTDVKYVWNGVTKDGKKVSAKVEGSLGKRLDKVDVMEKVPGFIKTLVGGVVGTRPYIYQVRIELQVRLLRLTAITSIIIKRNFR